MSSLISVIIPIYNVDKYLQRCLDSVINNTYRNLEIICVNDGSTDKCADILQSQTDERIIVITKENGGVSSARNVGMDIAKGDYIAFIDPDDMIHPQYFELLMDSILDSDVVCCSAYTVEESETIVFKSLNLPKGKPVFISGNEASRRGGTVRNHVVEKLFRRGVVDNIRFSPDIRFAEDKVFMSYVYSSVNRVSYISDKLYYYYKREGSAVKTLNKELLPAGKGLLESYKISHNTLVLENAYSILLSNRYLNTFSDNADIIIRETEKYLNECKACSNCLPWIHRTILNIMLKYPQIYRTFRIITDTTLIKWEKEQRTLVGK